MTKCVSTFDRRDPDDLAGINQRARTRFASERAMGSELTLDTLELSGASQDSFLDERRGFRGRIDHLVPSMGED